MDIYYQGEWEKMDLEEVKEWLKFVEEPNWNNIEDIIVEYRSLRINWKSGNVTTYTKDTCSGVYVRD